MQNTKAKFSFLIELMFISALLGSLILLLINFYPYPYYLVGGLLGGEAYDAEPDYFANIISTIMYGFSMDFLHPGIPLKNLSATIVSLFTETLSPEKIILISRASIIFINGMLIYIGSRLVLKQDLICTYALYAVFLVFPAGFILIDHLSPNSILFGLSVLIISIGSLVEKKISIQMGLFSFLLGIALAVKYTAILLIIPLIAFLVFDQQNSLIKNFNLFKILSFIALVSGASFSIFAWPMMPLVPYFFTLYGIGLPNVEMFPGLLVLIFIAIVAMSILLMMIYRIIIHFAFTNIYKKTALLFLACILILLLIQLPFHKSMLSAGYASRNYLPILGAVVLFIPVILNWFFNSRLQQYILITLILFLLLFLKLNHNLELSKKASEADQKFSSFLQKYDSYDFLVFYPSSSFISKDMFIAWADYRYGDSRKVFLEEEAPFLLTERQKKVRILNSRKFYLDLPEKKFAYKYLNALSKNNFLSNSYREVALNQMYLLQPKLLCNELFDGFEATKSSAIFFPISLKAYHSGNDLSSDDVQTYSYVNDLKLKLKNTCNINSVITREISYDQQKFYLLLIN